MRRIGLALLLAGALGLGAAARADVPRLINFQGRLADASGTPLTGSFTMTFRIYNAPTGGAACHQAAQTVAVNSGLFNVAIGAGAGISSACTFAVPYYLEVQVGTDAPMSPRIAMTASAYALGAASLVRPGANTAHTLGNGFDQVPLSNNAVNAGLNADMLDGYHYADIIANAVAAIPTPLYQCTKQAGQVCDADGNCSIQAVDDWRVTTTATTTCVSYLWGCYGTPPACPAGFTDLGVVEDGTCKLLNITRPRYRRGCRYDTPLLLGYVRAP